MKLTTIKTILFCLFYLTNQQLSFGQITEVFGKIQDAKTKEPLSFVQVYFAGTEIGLTSDLDGNYKLSTSEVVDSIAFVYLGYDRKVFTIKQHKSQEINVFLSEATLELNTAIITTERKKKREKDTAAIALWRNVVKHYPKNSIESADIYTYKDYTNTTFDWYNPGEKLLGNKIFDKGLGIMRDYVREESDGDTYLSILNKETIQEYAYRKNPLKRVEKVIADRFSGVKNASMSDYIGAELNKIDPFSAVNVIVGKSFIGPLSSTSDVLYNFFLTDSVERDGDKYYQLTFVGKRQQDFTFLGYAWVHKPTYGVESISLEISPHIALNHIQTLQVEQYYTLTPEKFWVKENEKLTTTIKVDLIDIGTRKNRNKDNQIRIRKDSKRYDLQINKNLPEELFEGDPMQWEHNSNKRDEVFWRNNRPEGLDSTAAGVYVMMDSVQNTFVYKLLDYFNYMGQTSYLRAGPIEFGKFPEFVSYNAIEGVRLKFGLRTSKKLSEVVQIGGYAAYGFKDKQWKYGIDGNFHLPTKNRKWNMLSVWYKNDFQMMAQQEEMLTNDNIITALTRIGVINNLMMIRDAGLHWEKDWVMGFSSRIGYQWRRFYSVPGGFNFTTGEGANPMPTYTSSEIRVRLHGGYKERFMTDFTGFKRSSLDAKFPIFTFDYTAGIKGLLGGEHNYHKLELNMRHRLNSPIGYTRYQLHVGKTFGDAPYPVLTVHLGNQNLIRNGWAYALMNEFEFVSDAYASVWVDHHFDGFILNAIPGINKLKWRSIFMFKALYGTVTDKNKKLIDMPAGISSPEFYAEIGFGIENIFKIVRIDFMWRLTHLNAPNARPFGINLVIAPKF